MVKIDRVWHKAKVALLEFAIHSFWKVPGVGTEALPAPLTPPTRGRIGRGSSGHRWDTAC